MLTPVNTISSVGTHFPQPTDSQVQVKASTEYIINSLNIVRMRLYSTDDTTIYYKLNRHEDRSPEMMLRVTETKAQIQTLADTAAASNMIALNVFLGETGEDCLTFAECDLAGSSTTEKYYNIDEIVWVEENADGDKCMLWVSDGGHDLNKIFADLNIDQFYDEVTTGTTTTTTSTTSTTTYQ